MTETIKALETIELLYQAALEPELWPQALDRLARACGGIGIAMIPIASGDAGGLIVSPALEESETLDLLGRHTALALVISTRLAAARALNRALEKTLAQLDCGALVLDRELRLVLANDAANRLLGDGLTINQGLLRASSHEQQSALMSLVRSVLERSADSVVEPIALARPSGRRPLLVQAIPIAAAAIDVTAPASAAVLLTVVDPERDDRDCFAVEQLRLLGLTPAEARVAALIGAGYSRKETAEALGISKSTVCDTVKQTYSKLDISRQSELVRLIGRLGALKSPHKPCGPL